MLTEDTRETTKMSEFGRTLYSLMLTRGIERRQDLLEKLSEGDYTISQTRLSYYLNGDRTVDPMFLECVAELLNLNKAERRQLGQAFAWGQLKHTPQERAKIRRYRERSRGEA